MTKSTFTEEYDRFRLLLIEARKAAGLTQADVAAALNRPQSFASKYESGERRLDVIELIQILRVLGADPADFIQQLEGQILEDRPDRHPQE